MFLFQQASLRPFLSPLHHDTLCPLVLRGLRRTLPCLAPTPPTWSHVQAVSIDKAVPLQ